jgi:hypothetical protein
MHIQKGLAFHLNLLIFMCVSYELSVLSIINIHLGTHSYWDIRPTHGLSMANGHTVTS